MPSTPNTSLTAANESWKVGSMHDDGRLRIEVVGGLLEPSGKCSRVITENIYERVEATGFNWKEVSKETKTFYFEEFKKSFVWRQEDKQIYRAWVRKASRRYSNFCSDARKKWEIGEQDNRIGTHVWLRWVEYWRTPDFQTKSTTQKRNRKGGEDHYPATHTGGSASHRTHAAVLAETNDKDPTPTDIYEHTHTVNNDRVTWVNKKAERVHKRIEELRKLRSQPLEGSSEPQPVDEDQLFLDAVGGPDNRNRVYGMGSLQSIIYGPQSSCNTATSRYNSKFNDDYHHMQVELQEMKDRVKELQQARDDELQEMRNQMNEMKNQLAMVLNNQN